MVNEVFKFSGHFLFLEIIKNLVSYLLKPDRFVLMLLDCLVETQDPQDRLIKTFLLLGLDRLKDDGGVDLL